MRAVYYASTHKAEKKGYDRPHLLDAQLTHWLVRLPPLAVLVLATVSELRTESASTLFVASADPYENRGELGTEGDEGAEDDRDTAVVGMSDVELITGEEGVDEEWEGAGEAAVVGECAVGFRNCSRAFIARENSELSPSLIARAAGSSELGDEASSGLGGTTASVGTPTLSRSVCVRASLVGVCLSRWSHGPAVGTALTVSTPQSAAFCPGGSATTSSPRAARPASCSCVRCATGIGNCQLAPTDMHATGARWSAAVSSVMRTVGSGTFSSNEGSCLWLGRKRSWASAAAAVAIWSLRCSLASALVRILQRIEESVFIPLHFDNAPGGRQLTQQSPPHSASTNQIPLSVCSSQPKMRPDRASWQIGLPP